MEHNAQWTSTNVYDELKLGQQHFCRILLDELKQSDPNSSAGFVAMSWNYEGQRREQGIETGVLMSWNITVIKEITEISWRELK
jgi:hypothetical protein